MQKRLLYSINKNLETRIKISFSIRKSTNTKKKNRAGKKNPETYSKKGGPKCIFICNHFV